MGMSKPKGPSQEEIKERQNQSKLLKEREKQAKLEEERARALRISSLKARRAGLLGRRSLITSGSELGTSKILG